MNRNLSFLAVVALAGAIAACSSDDTSSPGPSVITSFTQAQNWTCPSNISCQDVFDIHFEAGSKVTFTADRVTGGSILNVALYAPGTALGGTNLFTNNANEYRCGAVTDCDSLPNGQTRPNFTIAATGTYRFAVTRDWGESCGGNGTYRLSISSDKAFTKPTQSVNDKKSVAPGAECP